MKRIILSFTLVILMGNALLLAQQNEPNKNNVPATDRVTQRQKMPDPASSNEQDKDSDDKIMTIDAIDVVGERPLSAASDSTIRNKDFMNFPRKSASDLMRFVPGLHITQHTGGAKAHQIFLRGFDAEHGQDIAAYFDGIPINENSHVHGQGYLDLHFLIPESLEKIWIMKGPYDPRYGNFASAGVINFIPYRSRDYNYSLSGSGGSAYTFDGLGQIYQHWHNNDTYIVGEWDRTDGYTNPGELMAGRGFISHRIAINSKSEVRILYTGYTVRSEAADILPKALIEDGTLNAYDSLDDSNRVDVDRHIAGITYEYLSKDISARLQGYYNYKETRIFSNYTFYYYNNDASTGDQLEQSDERHYYGLQGHFRTINYAGNVEFSTEVGFQLRNDTIDQTQANTHRRNRFNLINNYDFNETSLGLYLDERILVTKWLQLIMGVRYDVIFYNGEGVQDRQIFDIATNSAITLQDVAVDLNTWAHAASPKISAVFMPLKELSIFLNFGRGFVSTQARQIAWDNKHTMPAITGAELGTRVKLWKDRITIAASGWAALKEKEYVFDSEFGMSIERGKSRRLGFDFEFRIEPLEWLYISTDLNYVNAVFADTDEPVPNMSEWMMTNNLSIIHPIGIRGSLRGRFIGPREHDMGYKSRSYYIVDLLIGYEHKHFFITGSIENLFNTEWYDSVFAYTSRPYAGGGTVEGLHATPGNPITWKLTAGCKF